MLWTFSITLLYLYKLTKHNKRNSTATTVTAMRRVSPVNGIPWKETR